MDPVFLAWLILGAAGAALFLLVGRTIQKRAVSPEARLANSAFVTWWYGLGATTLIGLALAVPLVPEDFDLYLVVTIVNLAIVSIALWGLLFYLVFLFTESRAAAVPLAGAYVAYFALLLYYILKSDPVGILHSNWGAEVEYANRVVSGPLYWSVILLLLLPQLFGALAYFSLVFRVDDPMQRRRIVLVSASILVWFGSTLLSTAGGVGTSDWWRILSKLIGLAAAGTIYYAYAGLKPRAPSPTGPQESRTSEKVETPSGRGGQLAGA